MHEERLEVCKNEWKMVEKHLEESISVRDRLSKVEVHVGSIMDTLKSFSQIRYTIWGIVFTIVLQIITFAQLWGQMSKQVDVDDKRISTLEEIHPRLK